MAIEQVTIDHTQYVVAELPQNLQNAVKKYEDWNERLALAQDEVTLVQAGLQQLGSSIVTAIRELNAAKASVEAATVVPQVVSEVPVSQ